MPSARLSRSPRGRQISTRVPQDAIYLAFPCARVSRVWGPFFGMPLVRCRSVSDFHPGPCGIGVACVAESYESADRGNAGCLEWDGTSPSPSVEMRNCDVGTRRRGRPWWRPAVMAEAGASPLLRGPLRRPPVRDLPVRYRPSARRLRGESRLSRSACSRRAGPRSGGRVPRRACQRRPCCAAG